MDKEELYNFRGFSSSLLNYDSNNSEWKLTLYSNPNIYATCNESTIYPFGTFNWYFYGETCKQIGKKNIMTNNVYKFPINFNACDPNTEFNCADGTW